jgi:hypothetical protein
MTEWKREGRTISAPGWMTTVKWSGVGSSGMHSVSDLESVGRLMRAAPELRDMVTDLIAWLEPWARLDTGEKYREAIVAARKLLREIEGDG